MEKYTLRPEGEKSADIYFADLNESHKATMKVAEIRIDAKIKIFDIVKENHISKHRSTTPQSVVCETKFTHELMEQGDPYIIGKIVLDAYMKLKVHVNNHLETGVKL